MNYGVIARQRSFEGGEGLISDETMRKPAPVGMRNEKVAEHRKTVETYRDWLESSAWLSLLRGRFALSSATFLERSKLGQIGGCRGRASGVYGSRMYLAGRTSEALEGLLTAF